MPGVILSALHLLVVLGRILQRKRYSKGIGLHSPGAGEPEVCEASGMLGTQAGANALVLRYNETVVFTFKGS